MILEYTLIDAALCKATDCSLKFKGILNELNVITFNRMAQNIAGVGDGGWVLCCWRSSFT